MKELNEMAEKIDYCLDKTFYLTVNSKEYENFMDVLLFAKKENDKKIRNAKILELLRKDRNKNQIFDLKKSEHIIKKVCDDYGLDVEQIKSQSRKTPLPEARFISYRLIKDSTELSLKSIGKIFNGRDHTTVINGLTAVNNWNDTDIDFRKRFSFLEKSITLELENIEIG